MENKFTECAEQLPENGVIVFTKIDDAKGLRNEGLLSRTNNLWFVPDGSMYVYYSPTHWRPATVEELQREREGFAEKAQGQATMDARQLARLDDAIAAAK